MYIFDEVICKELRWKDTVESGIKASVIGAEKLFDALNGNCMSLS